MTLAPLALAAALAAAPGLLAQAANSTPEKSDDETIVLSPFEVTTTNKLGYHADTTLAGNRLSTDLRDVGSAVTVVTKEFLKDVGATDSNSLLVYTTGTEVGGTKGNFAGVGDTAALSENTISPNQNTRVRGLSAADNTRDFFRTDIPWDGYNIERVDLQRGPNSILFGQGSPSGIINAGLNGAQLNATKGSFELGFGSYGGARASLDYNQALIKGELAIRVDLVRDQKRFQQDPAFSNDERAYGALRYEPKFLRKNGARTIIKASYEAGRINSNNPRELPPVDTLTPWFTKLNQATYNQYQAWDHVTGRPNSGQLRVNLASGQKNPAYEPYLGIFGFPGNPDAPTFLSGNGSTSIWALNPTGAFQTGGRDSSGNIDGGIGSMIDNKWVSLVGTAQMAINAGLPYANAGLWKNNMITDPGIFDFYNKLIDGDTKREWQKFHVYNASILQTFLNDKLGLSLDYNREHYNNGQKAILPGEVRLQVDPMAVFGNGTPEAGYNGGMPWSNGTKNPNVGRAFVSSNNAWSNRSYTSDRETTRLTGFYTQEFDKGTNNWFLKILGTHTLTGMLSNESFKSDSRAWQRYGVFDNDTYNLFGFPQGRFNESLTPAQVIYLGDSLLGKSAGSANIPSISGHPTLSSGSLNYFNSTWKGNVDPGAFWGNGIYPETSQYFNSTQAENPSNYVGWTTRPFSIVDAESSTAARDRLTTAADLRKATTSSQVFAWQAKWLQNSIASTFGWRKDVAKAWATSLSPNSRDPNNVSKELFPYTADRGSMASYLNSPAYRLPDTYNRIEVQSRSYSAAIHLMDLPYIKELTSRLPVEVTLLYNRSTNFKPDASRVDVYGEPIAAPSGKTIDRGILLETRDRRYFLKLNKYVTYSYNANSTQINASAIGNWMQLTQNYANIFQYNLIPWETDATKPANRGLDTDIEGPNSPWRMRYNFHYYNTPGRTWSNQAVVSSDGQWVVDPVLEGKIIGAVRTMQRAVDPRFWKAWGIDTFGDFGLPTGPSNYHTPAGLTIVEDNISSGYEIETGGEPLKGWRISVNASKTDARRTNVGDPHIRELMATIESSLKLGTPDGVGAMHHYWGSEDVVTAGKNWYDGEGLIGAPGSEWRLSQLIENTKVPELRDWRVNLISNYEFQRGLIKGLSIGGALRYQSSAILAYRPKGNPADPRTIEYDFTNPIKSPSESSIDAWVGYSHRIGKNLNWKIQLNVYDVNHGKDSLIPITAQPTGEFAAYRIAPKRSWRISNTIEF